MNEEWRPIQGYEGMYEVSDRGRVRSLTRKVQTRWGGFMTSEGKVLAPGGSGNSDHQRVSLRRDGAAITYKVHRLVLEAFVGRCPQGLVACHNNGDPKDNRVENLRWDTRRSNNLDKVTHGTDHNVVKTHCPQGHPYDEGNTITRSGKRICRACSNKASRDYHRTHKPDLSRLTHGRVGTYSRGGCRCDECRNAAREWNKARAAKMVLE